ncbi:hypothetical protein [Blattabacterium sp. (Cryptocercus punctulatus) str. Cpu]|nr:hypothetical protein [Blattabacterium sp. (Cryptocercus punctulatus) str. Cpu]
MHQLFINQKIIDKNIQNMIENIRKKSKNLIYKLKKNTYNFLDKYAKKY